MIELKNVTKTYPKKDTAVQALAGVSLQIAEGEIFGVIGSSGAGKSTLIRCINLLEPPTSGGCDRRWRGSFRAQPAPTGADAEADRHDLPAFQSFIIADGF